MARHEQCAGSQRAGHLEMGDGDRLVLAVHRHAWREFGEPC